MRHPINLESENAFEESAVPLVRPASETAPDYFSVKPVAQPKVPAADERGHNWRPDASDLNGLWSYTFGYQLNRPYHFTWTHTVSAREITPDHFIITGPGTKLGGLVAQALITTKWPGLSSNLDFHIRQEMDSSSIYGPQKPARPH